MEVIPCAPTDQVKPVDNIRTRTFFIVDACLDENVMQSSLDRLIRSHWRKLGGRLVARRKDGLLEYHIPEVFGPDYTLFNWSARHYDHSIDKTASAIRSPPLDKGPQLLPALEVVDSWFRPSDWPYHRRDEPPDSPMLYLHLSLFTDATVIAVSLPHSLADQMGLSNILQAWMAVAQDREPPAFVGYEGDLLPGRGKTYKDYPRADIFGRGRQRVYRPGEYTLAVLPLFPDLIRHQEKRVLLFLPLQLVGALREKYTQRLAEEHKDFSKISDGDVITAVLAKISSMHRKTPGTLSLSQTINLRNMIPELNPERSKGFIHNSLHTAAARFRMGPTTPVSELAYANRKAIERSRDPRRIEADLAVAREMVRRGQSSVVCEPFDRIYHVSNWCAAWRDVDFSPFVKGGQEPPARPKLLVLGQSGERKAPLRYSAIVLSKTDEGYWVQFAAAVPAMKLMEEYLRKDPLLEDF